MKATWLTGAFVMVAAAAGAQPVAVDTPRAVDSTASQARFQMRVMESVLENAVLLGAQALGSELQRVSPGVTLFSGPARARGFRLDGYGMFFAVDVPALHRSILWSVRTLSQSNGDLVRAMQSIKRMVDDQSDPRMKGELERAFKLVEMQVMPAPPAAALRDGAYGRPERNAERTTGRTATRPASAYMPARGAAGATPQAPPSIPDDAPAPQPDADAPVLSDAAYTSSVQGALIDAMLDYGSTLPLGPEEWLTIAARENGDIMVAGDITETVTVTLRVKGGDLEALKTGRLSRDEVRQRVQVASF